jgi:hypothetical protein
MLSDIFLEYRKAQICLLEQREREAQQPENSAHDADTEPERIIPANDER